jgi:hypothetical protein
MYIHVHWTFTPRYNHLGTLQLLVTEIERTMYRLYAGRQKKREQDYVVQHAGMLFKKINLALPVLYLQNCAFHLKTTVDSRSWALIENHGFVKRIARIWALVSLWANRRTAATTAELRWSLDSQQCDNGFPFWTSRLFLFFFGPIETIDSALIAHLELCCTGPRATEFRVAHLEVHLRGSCHRLAGASNLKPPIYCVDLCRHLWPNVTNEDIWLHGPKTRPFQRMW